MLTILVVDDDELVRQTLVKVLRHGNLDVIATGSATEAVELAAEHDIDVVLADVRMPGMSGVELARRLHSSHPHLRILLSSGDPPDAALADCEFADEIEYLQKPFAPSALVRLLVE